MKILIVEDEPLIARRLERFCRDILGPSVEGLRVAPSFASGQAALAEQPVDLLLLDLNLDGADGMELLKTTVAEAFHTVIVSANTEHALRAFEYGVLDFVPKPFTPERLGQALRRATDAAGALSPRQARFLACKKHGRVELVAIDDIVYAQGAGNYTELVLGSGRRELHDKNLERLAAVLPPVFERIHKSYLVRLTQVVALHASEGSHYEAELKSGERLPVGRQRYKELRQKLS